MPASQKERVAAARGEYESLPRWTRIGFDDVALREKLEEGIRTLAQYDTEELLAFGSLSGPVYLRWLDDCVGRSSANGSIDFVYQLLKRCPAWTKLAPHQVEDRQRVMDAISQLSEFPPSVLRAAIQRYSKEVDGGVHEMAVVYLLHRFYFNVPQSARGVPRVFGSYWISNLSRNNELAPLERDGAGNLRLSGDFLGYQGGEYRALDEFDYFRKTFGRRKGAIAAPKGRPR